MNFSKEEVQAILLRIEYEVATQGMSKKDFYAKSGVSSSLYSQWNTGAVKPTMKSLGKVADALGISLASLLGEKEKPAPDGDELIRTLQMLRDREDLRVLLDVSAKRTPEQVRRLAALMESFPEG